MHDRYSDDHSGLVDPRLATDELIAVAQFLKRRAETRHDRTLPPDAVDILQMSQKRPEQLLWSIARGSLTRHELDDHKKSLIRASFQR